MKRAFDLLLALCLAIPALVVCFLLLAPIYLDTRASPIFRQQRLGQNRRQFTILKLRTMRRDTPDGASHEVGASHITRLGSVLRKLKLDELPQIWNVLRGDMSFVGPRPGLPGHQELTDAREKHGVFSLKPGITGPSQIEGIDMSNPEDLALSDSRYLAPWSFRSDLGLIAATVSGKGRGDAALRPHDLRK